MLTSLKNLFVNLKRLDSLEFSGREVFKGAKLRALSSNGDDGAGAVARQLDPVRLVAAEEVDVLAPLVEMIEQADVEAPAAADHHHVSALGGAGEDRPAEAHPGPRHVRIVGRLAGGSLGDKGQERPAP